MTYDSLGRLSEWRQALTTADQSLTSSNDQVYDAVVNYAYDVDDYVISVNQSDTPATWHRRDGHWTSDHMSDDNVIDGDGFVVVRSGRGGQRLEWNSLGQLIRVTSNSVNTTYSYDALGRLTVVNDLTRSVQLFYADLRHPERITHVHDLTTHVVTEYLYDQSEPAHLHAARINAKIMLYVAVDPHGSPLRVFNESGHVVRRMRYTPLGGLMQNTGRADTQWHIANGGAFHDSSTGLLFFNSKVLDPDNGRWLAANTQPFIDRCSHSLKWFIHHSDPYDTNFLRHGDVAPPSLMLSKSHFVLQYCCCSLLLRIAKLRLLTMKLIY